MTNWEPREEEYREAKCIGQSQQPTRLKTAAHRTPKPKPDKLTQAIWAAGLEFKWTDISPSPSFFSCFNASHPQQIFWALFLSLFLGNRTSTSYCEKKGNKPKWKKGGENAKGVGELKRGQSIGPATWSKIFSTFLFHSSNKTLLLTAKPLQRSN